MSKIDLLPCPFCGRKPKVSELHIHLQQISCLYSKCPAHPCVIKATMEEATEAWNTRASGWIPCSAMLPEDDTDVLAYNDCDGVLIANYSQMEAFECYPLTSVTHWMPLPEAPKRKEDE